MKGEPPNASGLPSARAAREAAVVPFVVEVTQMEGARLRGREGPASGCIPTPRVESGLAAGVAQGS